MTLLVTIIRRHLFTSDEERETVQVPEAELPIEEDSDILNSPQFLRRKVDVLTADLAEWWPKFDRLMKEVSGRMTILSAFAFISRVFFCIPSFRLTRVSFPCTP